MTPQNEGDDGLQPLGVSLYGVRFEKRPLSDVLLSCICDAKISGGVEVAWSAPDVYTFQNANGGDVENDYHSHHHKCVDRYTPVRDPT
jgi:hypothetical protein